MIKQIEFTEEETFFPITMEQFETLSNEILFKINDLVAPHFLTGDYVAQMVMSAIHAYPHTVGILKKTELFYSCVNRISNHVSFHCVEAIQERLKAQNQTDEKKDVDETSGIETATQTH